MSHPPINPDAYPHGILCGCDCGCSRALNDGNSMSEEVRASAAIPWRIASEHEYDLPGFVSICADCYVGSHARPSSTGGKET